MHSATQQPLCLEDAIYPNDFGNELEVTGCAVQPANMTSVLEKSSKVGWAGGCGGRVGARAWLLSPDDDLVRHN